MAKTIEQKDKRIAKLEALLREAVTSIEFDELGLGTLDEKIRRELVQS